MVFEEDIFFDAPSTALEVADSGEVDPGRCFCWEEEVQGDMKDISLEIGVCPWAGFCPWAYGEI